MSDPSGDKLSRLGVKATLLYLILLLGGVPVLAYFSIIELAPLKLSELGDFLAGAFGPLAIFWLILGFFQQGNELRNSIATLKLQADELANSVEQQRELVAVTRDSLKHEVDIRLQEERQRIASIQPRFIVKFGGGSQSGITVKNSFILTNIGKAASRVNVYFDPIPFRFPSIEKRFWDAGKEERFEVQFHEKDGINERFQMKIVFFDSDNNERNQYFNIAPLFGSPSPMQIQVEEDTGD